MTRSPKSPARVEAEGIVERLRRDHSPDVVEEVQRVLEETGPRSMGRPKGTGTDDLPRLERAADLLEAGEVEDPDDAIVIAAREDPGDSERNTRKRLRRKLPDFLAERKRDTERARKQEVLEAAFEEDIEVWDL